MTQQIERKRLTAFTRIEDHFKAVRVIAVDKGHGSGWFGIESKENKMIEKKKKKKKKKKKEAMMISKIVHADDADLGTDDNDDDRIIRNIDSDARDNTFEDRDDNGNEDAVDDDEFCTFQDGDDDEDAVDVDDDNPNHNIADERRRRRRRRRRRIHGRVCTPSIRFKHCKLRTRIDHAQIGKLQKGRGRGDASLDVRKCYQLLPSHRIPIETYRQRYLRIRTSRR